VLPTLAGDDDAYALITGQRSARTPQSDGTIKRRGLRSQLPGGVGLLHLERTDTPKSGWVKAASYGHSGLVVAFRKDEGRARWRFLQGEPYYLAFVALALGARAVVDTTGDFLSALSVPEKPSYYSGVSLLAPDLIVLPDTYESRRRYQVFTNGQRVPPFVTSTSEPQEVNRPPPLNLVAQEARCSVTGWMENGERKPAQDLEAARLLLLERFDLKLGLWDLASNPVLRDTLLDPKSQAPVPRRRPAVTSGVVACWHHP
jgi:hypothetical protein